MQTGTWLVKLSNASAAAALWDLTVDKLFDLFPIGLKIFRKIHRPRSVCDKSIQVFIDTGTAARAKRMRKRTLLSVHLQDQCSAAKVRILSII